MDSNEEAEAGRQELLMAVQVLYEMHLYVCVGGGGGGGGSVWKAETLAEFLIIILNKPSSLTS